MRPDPPAAVCRGRRGPRLAAAAVLLVASALGLAGRAFAAPLVGDVPVAATPLVVIDPGHGGADTGARGPQGRLEKAVTLELARALSTRLGKTCRVMLTREDDREMPLAQRTGMANHHKAAAFVSLHVGASFRRSVDGAAVFYYAPAGRNSAAAAFEDMRALDPAASQGLWETTQLAHLAASRRLAGCLHDRWRAAGFLPACRLAGAPLWLLAGADMPAVLLEIGCLTNPAAEKRLTDPGHLSEQAAVIGRGIEDFLRALPP